MNTDKIEDINKEQCLKLMKGLTDKQFVQLFYEAMSGRNTSDMGEDVAKGHFILADVLTWEDKEINIEFVGLNFYKEDTYEDDYPICQSGTCQNCKNKIRSFAKRILCPICSNEAYGT